VIASFRSLQDEQQEGHSKTASHCPPSFAPHPPPFLRVCTTHLDTSQASLLYLLLCFSPQTLHRDGPMMRTLVDRHYADCWVVPWGHACYTGAAALMPPSSIQFSDRHSDCW